MKENDTENTVQYSQAQVSVICKHKSSVFKDAIFITFGCCGDPALDSRLQTGMTCYSFPNLVASEFFPQSTWYGSNLKVLLKKK